MSPNGKNKDLEYWEKRIEGRSKKRSTKGKPRMKVSGAGVKVLERIIRSK